MAHEPVEPEGEDDDGPASTPFDNPYFLPVLLWVFAAWFFYDGWFNPKMEWIRFNRYGFAVCGILATWYSVRAVRERRAEQEQERRPTGSD